MKENEHFSTLGFLTQQTISKVFNTIFSTPKDKIKTICHHHLTPKLDHHQWP